MEKGLTQKYYSSSDILYDWYPENNQHKLEDIKEIVSASPSGIFLVVQSTLQIDPKSLAQLIFSSKSLLSCVKIYSYWLLWKVNKFKADAKSDIKLNIKKVLNYILNLLSNFAKLKILLRLLVNDHKI
jgi:hypothetical protein